MIRVSLEAWVETDDVSDARERVMGLLERPDIKLVSILHAAPTDDDPGEQFVRDAVGD